MDMERYDDIIDDLNKNRYNFAFNQGRLGFVMGLHKTKGNPYNDDENYHLWLMGFNMEANIQDIDNFYEANGIKEDEMEKRWKVVITFQYVKETETETFYIEELEELQDIVEEGPDWRTIKDIVVTLN